MPHTNASTIEVDGLKATISNLRWNAGEKLQFTYALQVTNRVGLIVTPKAAVECLFSNSAHNRIGNPVVKKVSFSTEFVEGATNDWSCALEVEVPQQAFFISVRLGVSDLETNEIAIPAR
jgi:hypothetical protein